MFRRARELGPPVLVPLAWTYVTAVHLGFATTDGLFVAHAVMTVLLAGFAVTGRADMREGALAVWWRIIAVGTLLALSGVVGFLVGPGGSVLQAVALGGWMLLPAVGFVDTARRVADGAGVYLGGAGLCLLGAAVYAGGNLAALDAAVVAGLAGVGVGQTAGILDAARRD